MPIFPRRVLQRFLDENRKLFTPNQLRTQLERLNRADVVAIYAEWELVFVDLFRSEWNIRYEPNLGAKKRLDVVFAPSSDEGQPFALDVTAVTQKSYVAANRIDEFLLAFQELAKAKEVPLGRLFFRVENADVL